MIHLPIYGRDAGMRVLRAYTLIDEADHELVRELRLNLTGVYVSTSFCGERLLLHRLITDAPAGLHVHHVNHNPLDNRRANLELLTPDEHRARHGRRWETNAAD